MKYKLGEILSQPHDLFAKELLRQVTVTCGIEAK